MKTGQGVKWTFCVTAVKMATLKGKKTLTELAQQFEVHATQIMKWKAQLVEGAAEIFRWPPCRYTSTDLRQSIACKYRRTSTGE